MKKKITAKKRTKPQKINSQKKWEQEVKKEVQPGRMIPEDLAQKAPA